MSDPTRSEIHALVRRYADAWAAGDLARAFDCYHDDFALHYFGRNPLAGTHRGKDTCLGVLMQVTQKTNRKLVEIRDVLAGDRFGLIVAVEDFLRSGEPVRVERLLRYAVKDGKLAECWIYDEDQRLIDEFLS